MARYPASQSFLISFSQTVEAIHLPPAPDPDIFGRPLWAEKTNARALELERRGMDREEESVGAKGNPYPLIKAMNIKRLPTRLKLAYSQGSCKQHGWVTHAFFFLCSSIPSRSSPSTQAFAFSIQKGLPKMSGSGTGGKWMACTVREKDIKKLWEAGYLAKKISHRLQSSFCPHERVVFCPHFVHGLGFPSTHSFAASCIITGSIFTIYLPIPSSTSLHTTSCARPFSASCHTSAYG